MWELSQRDFWIFLKFVVFVPDSPEHPERGPAVSPIDEAAARPGGDEFPDGLLGADRRSARLQHERCAAAGYVEFGDRGAH